MTSVVINAGKLSWVLPPSTTDFFKPCLRPGYFLLWSSDCMMDTYMLLAGVRVHEHW